MAEDGLGGVGWEAAGVAGGAQDVEQELGKALAVGSGGGGFVEDGEFRGAFETFARELVQTDGDGLAKVHGEMASFFG